MIDMEIEKKNLLVLCYNDNINALSNRTYHSYFFIFHRNLYLLKYQNKITDSRSRKGPSCEAETRSCYQQ